MSEKKKKYSVNYQGNLYQGDLNLLRKFLESRNKQNESNNIDETSNSSSFLNELNKSWKKKNKKKGKKKHKKTCANVEENPTIKNKISDNISRAVMINKALLKKDADAQKAWKEEYFNGLFFEFKNFVMKYNEGLQFKEQELIKQINYLELQVKEYENKLKDLKQLDEILKKYA